MRKWKESNGLCREKQQENKKTEQKFLIEKMAEKMAIKCVLNAMCNGRDEIRRSL